LQSELARGHSPLPQCRRPCQWRVGGGSGRARASAAAHRRRPPRAPTRPGDLRPGPAGPEAWPSTRTQPCGSRVRTRNFYHRQALPAAGSGYRPLRSYYRHARRAGSAAPPGPLDSSSQFAASWHHQPHWHMALERVTWVHSRSEVVTRTVSHLQARASSGDAARSELTPAGESARTCS
jgi:hypothetical protein